ncbi:MAG: hypothetical protein AAF557_27535 [Pseudomonadota bacterium]
MSWVLIVVISGQLQMQPFNSERACNNAGHSVSYAWKALHPPEKDTINITWTCVKQ